MTKDELRAHAAVEFGKVFFRSYLKSNPVSHSLADQIAMAAVVAANKLVEHLYPEEKP